MNTAAIAKHFNVIESAIVRVEEWKNCLFCVVRGIGARFVSKKVAKVTQISKEEVEALVPSYGDIWRIWKPYGEVLAVEIPRLAQEVEEGDSASSPDNYLLAKYPAYKRIDERTGGNGRAMVIAMEAAIAYRSQRNA